MPHKRTISDVIKSYLDTKRGKNERSSPTYETAMRRFSAALLDHGLNPDKKPIKELKEDHVTFLIEDTKKLALPTRRLYLSIVTDFYRHLGAENILENVNLPRVQAKIKSRVKKTPVRLPTFPKEEIESLIQYAESLNVAPYENEIQHLINLRDRALLLTLADTGLRIFEACGLKRGEIDYNTNQAVVIGKGDKQAVIRFSTRSIGAIRDYLQERSKIDGASGESLASLPVFSRHDRGMGKVPQPITTTTGRAIVEARVKQSIELNAVDGKITPHSLRHRFVTEILAKTKNMKLAQELARHSNISTTQRYAHLADYELNNGYAQVFEE